ncbi:nuclear transport factor 2 family protein [Modestobacter versicolor]|uniref:nuclear transport factor 2 family protein n=1 Tax=Modestobacter versicolor TaxID=429133 RepID=UPI0034DDF440
MTPAPAEVGLPDAPGPTTASITRWVEAYVTAWKSNDPGDIEVLFTDDAEYHESPFDTQWIGRDAIVEGWRSRWDWQSGGWEFEWSITAIDGWDVVITGIGRYAELGDFDNLWTVTFEESGRCSRFVMVNTERS